MKMLYRLEVSYQTANGKFHRDGEILKEMNYENEKSGCGFGWRDLVFSFDSSSQRDKSLYKISKLSGLRVTLYEIPILEAA